MSRSENQFLAMCMKLLIIEETILRLGEITTVLANLLGPVRLAKIVGSAPMSKYCAHNNRGLWFSVVHQISHPDKYRFQHCFLLSRGYMSQIPDLREANELVIIP
ncbi:hypothetical protein CQZ93_16575 [Ochrobactrum vermis]|nr:hypothetical protein CQZ93_16575 [Ochrobactrum vermis]